MDETFEMTQMRYYTHSAPGGQVGILSVGAGEPKAEGLCAVPNKGSCSHHDSPQPQARGGYLRHARCYSQGCACIISLSFIIRNFKNEKIVVRETNKAVT